MKYFKNATKKKKVSLIFLTIVVVLMAISYIPNLFNFQPKISESFKMGIESTVKNPKDNRIILNDKDVTDKYYDEVKRLYENGDFKGIYKLLNLDGKTNSLELTIDDEAINEK